MEEMTDELRQVLTLLQSREEWSTRELSATLQITMTAVMRHLSTLRRLGYEVEPTPGDRYSVRLVGSAIHQPINFSDRDDFSDRDVAVILRSLRRAIANPPVGQEEDLLHALATWEQAAPLRVTYSVESMEQYEDPALTELRRKLLTYARAKRDGRKVTFRYPVGGGEPVPVALEPYGVRFSEGQWLMVGGIEGIHSVVLYNFARVTHPRISEERFTPPPESEPGEFAGIHAQPLVVLGELEVAATAAQVRAALPYGVGEAWQINDGRCRLLLGGHTATEVAHLVMRLPYEFTVISPPEVREELHAIGERLRRT